MDHDADASCRCGIHQKGWSKIVDVVRTGDGQPVTIYAPGGIPTEAAIPDWMRNVQGTTVSFVYDRVSPWADSGAKRPRREADRDAEELLAIADDYQATRVVGSSRGARATLGVLADAPERFERAALIVPPGGYASGRYVPWLASLPLRDPDLVKRSDRYASWMASLAPDNQVVRPPAEILVIGQRRDPGHPARVADDWADRLGAQYELFRSDILSTAHREAFIGLVTDFLNSQRR